MDTRHRRLILFLVLAVGVAVFGLLLVANVLTSSEETVATTDTERGFPIAWFVIFIAVLSGTLIPLFMMGNRRNSPPATPTKSKRNRNESDSQDDEPFEIGDDNK